MTRSAKRNGRSGAGGRTRGGTGGGAGRDEPSAPGASERAARHGGAYLDGFGVVDSGDDDPVLVTPEGRARDAWREDYPYDRKLRRRDYDKAKRALQIELLKLQHWVKERDQRLV
ncbi:hypothetical protein ACIQWZ_16880 [Streptomyces sp. NPDC098077]